MRFTYSAAFINFGNFTKQNQFMQLTGIISISGKAGLSKIVSQTRTGLIVEALDNGKRTAIHGAEKVSSLEDISIYTYEDDILLSDVFQKMFDAAKGEKILSHKSSADELKAYLSEILPDYDEDRVYVSDIKKLVQWYNILQEKDLLKADEKAEDEDSKVKKGAKKTAPQKPKNVKPKNTAKPSGKAASGKKTSPKGAAKGK